MKHFGVEFKETEKGFSIEFSGDEETIKARKEAVAAWHEFVSKAKKAGLPIPHHGLHRHLFHHHGQCCQNEAPESTEKE